MSYQGRAVNRIQWFEGMLLVPQHFQQTDQRIDNLFNIHMANSVKDYWGVLGYQIDEAALISGRVSFLSLEAILPDGTYFAMTPDETARFTVDFSKVMQDSADNMITIYLAIPQYVAGYATVSTDLPRYLSIENIEVCDENTGTVNDSLPVLRPNVMLLLGDKPSSRYASFPLLRIKKSDNGFVLDERFVPPQLKLKQVDTLGQMCGELNKKIREKIAFLSRRLQDQTDNIISTEAENAVKSLSIGLLPFEAIIQSGGVHPFTAYLALCQLAASISTLQVGQMPPSFAPYDHNEIYQSYSQVIDYIYNMMARIQEGYSVIPFQILDRVFKLPLHENWQSDKLIIGAKAPKGMSLAELVEWINSAVITTDSFVSSVREKRILGASRRIIESENEMKLMPAKDMVLFAIDNLPDFINLEESLNIFNVADQPAQRPIELVIYVPRKG